MVKKNQATSFDDIEQELKTLQASKDKWVAIGIDERITILDEIMRDFVPVLEHWVEVSIEAKGIPKNTFGEAEEWAYLAIMYGILGSLHQSLVDIRKYGNPQVVGHAALRPSGQVVAKVFPRTRTESMMFPSLTGEVWMEPGVSIEETLQTQAQTYKDKHTRGAVNAILGAGSVSALPVSDVLYKLFVANHVAVLKPNPVNAYLGPLIEEGLQTLINQDFLRIVYGGAAEGIYLCNHPLVDEIHITGSDKTFEAIVFGSGTEGVKNKAEKRPLVSKPFTGELGCVNPVIIVPGPWNEDDIRKQAVKLMTWLSVNSGCNCLTPRVLVQHKSWTQRVTLVNTICDVMAKLETRTAYYPGTKEKHAAFVSAHPDACQFGDSDHGHLPWTFITNVDPENANDICFNTEVFCSLYTETALEAPSIPEFIDRAVDFVNETLWGTLTVSIIIHPKSLLDPDVSASFERALVNLRYGTICVNEWAGMAWFFGRTPWGGFPGHDIYDIQSGVGFVNNPLMFSKPQKSVIYSPFKKRIDPTLISFKHALEMQKRLTYYLASPSIWKLLGLVWTQFRG